jgi:hypothetical protein
MTPLTQEFLNRNLHWSDLPSNSERAFRQGYESGCRNGDWHDAKEELPPADTDVLVVTTKGKFVVTATYEQRDGTLHWKSNWGGSITHWMYLPNQPKATTK